LKKQFEREGFIVLRTAGSHGFADLIAIKRDERLIRFIQCKPDNFSDTEKEKLLSQYLDFQHHIWTSNFEVI
jgi:Holliday junction resolvase